MYDEIKSLLGIEGDGRDSLLSTIVGFTEDRLRVLLGGVEEVPPELEYIVYELSVIRFNRIGSEGMSAHSVEGKASPSQMTISSGFSRTLTPILTLSANRNGGR